MMVSFRQVVILTSDAKMANFSAGKTSWLNGHVRGMDLLVYSFLAILLICMFNHSMSLRSSSDLTSS